MCVCMSKSKDTDSFFFFFTFGADAYSVGAWGPHPGNFEHFFSCILVNFYVLCHAFLIYGLFLGDIVILDILTSTQKHFVATILVLSQNIPLIKMKGSL